MATIEILQVEDLSGGMNVVDDPNEIDDNQAVGLVDVLVHRPGESSMRGPVTAASGVYASWTKPAIGIVAARQPLGATRVAVMNGDGSSAKFDILSSSFASVGASLSWNSTFSGSKAFIFDAKPALGGGAWVCTTDSYQLGGTPSVGLWRGSDKADYTTGTANVAHNSQTVTGSGTSWSTNAAPGMFLFTTGGHYVGTVAKVNSNTSITLEDAAYETLTSSTYKLTSIRGINYRYVKGRITTSTSSTTLTGANTKFADNFLDNGSWYFFRESDGKYIGSVSNVVSNTSITLTTNATVACDNDAFYAIHVDADYSVNSTSIYGVFTAIYAERQWFANRQKADHINGPSKIYFSDPVNPEALDIAPKDGDWILVTSGSRRSSEAPIMQIMPAYNSLLILKEQETFALFGSDPDSFELRKIADDGTLSAMSVVQWEDGVIFAGRGGIYFYDGTEIQNIVEDSLGDTYRKAVTTFNPETYRMWAIRDRDFYFLYIESISSSFTWTKGATTTTPTRITIGVHLPTAAVMLFTNLNIKGGVLLPGDQTQPFWYVVNNSSGARICDFNALFDSTGADTITCTGDTIGPSPWVETKRYSVGEQVRKKLWKQLSLHHSTDGDTTTLDTIPGLNSTGTSTAATFDDTSGSWDISRLKFLKRAHHMGFRMYPTNNTATTWKLGPFAVVFKRQSPQKV